MNSEVFELRLDTMTQGGSALGRHEGRAIFVPYGLAGETIQARLVEDKGSYARAEVVEIVEASPSRVEPPCPDFGAGKCGGCQWQHIDYAAQLKFKQQIVVEQMARIGGFREAVVHPTLPSPDAWHYRTHATVQFTPDGQPGFVGTDQRRVVAVEDCQIIRPELVKMMGALQLGKKSSRDRMRLQVGTAPNDRFSAWLVGDEDDSSSYRSSSNSHVYYDIKGRRLRVTAGGFFQVNLPQAEALVDLVLAGLNLQGHEKVLDVYAGVGLFSVFLADHAQQLTAIEVSPSAVNDALENLSGLKHVEVIRGAAETLLGRLKSQFDAIVLDPPRAGLKPKALDAVVRMGASRVVYVSCDPATLARDAKRIGAAGYRLVEVQPVDMFPQTYHVESVALFSKI